MAAATAISATGTPRLALLLPSLAGGGVARMTLNLVPDLLARGYAVDLVLGRGEGSLADLAMSEAAGVVPLAAAAVPVARLATLRADPAAWRVLLRPILLPLHGPPALAALPSLVRYLRTVRPEAMIAAKTHTNLLAIWARRLAGVPSRLAVSERSMLSREIRSKGRRWRWRHIAPLVGRHYPLAEGIVAVSEGVAADLAAVAGLPRARITTIYNPVLTPGLLAQAQAPLDHPWLAPGAPPLILGVGRLAPQKDFATLIRAFAQLRAQRPAHLLLLGEGRLRAELEALVQSLGLAGEVALPGFCANPFAWMARARVLALSSRYEGFGNVLVEAMACGCPVVSTECPSGPAEILAGGRFGPLVAVGDAEALARALAHSLERPLAPETLRRRAAAFSAARAANHYLALLGLPRYVGTEREGGSGEREIEEHHQRQPEHQP